MGDRANVYVQDGNTGVFLYTHWSGTELPQTVQDALVRGRGRWSDGPYLARIVFCEMVRGDEEETTGYGISARCGDGADRIIVLDPDGKTVAFGRASDSGGVKIEGEPMAMAAFVEMPEPEWPER